MGRRLRVVLGLLALAELVVFVLVAGWIGVGWTILAMLATSALGAVLLGRQGTKALRELQERARTRRPAGRELGNAGLIAIGGLLMLLPGFLGDLIGLLCLLPGTRDVVRALLTRTLYAKLPDHMRGPVRVRSARVEEVPVGEEVRVDGVRVDGVRVEGVRVEGVRVEGVRVEGVEVQEVWRPRPRPAGAEPLVIEGEVERRPGA